LKRLTATFLVEAREHVQALGAGLLELEKVASRGAQLPLIETLFREAHSLKGAARAVNAGEIEHLCQKLEGVFSDLKSGKRAFSAEALDGLHRAAAVLGQLIDAIEAGQPLAAAAELAAVLQQLAPNPGTATVAGLHETVIAPEQPVPPEPATVPPAAAEPAAGVAPTEPTALTATDARTPTTTHASSSAADTVRIATSKLDAVLVQAEELLGLKLAQTEHAFEFRALAGLMAERDRLWADSLPLVRSLRQQIEARVDAPVRGADAGSVSSELPARLLAFLDQDRERAEAVSTRVADLARTTTDDRRRFDTVADRLLEDVKKALMLPFETILAGFPKMVRDMARDAGKDIEFNMRGVDIEIDKRIIEKIKDPLLHLVRNGVDHGIEPPAERARQRKPPRGTVTLAIAQTGGKVEITVADDGAGIDLAAVKGAAVQAGVVAAGEAAALGDQAARQLVFRSGVTTSRQVTAISGRGLGMAIVEESVTKLGGTVSIESTAGAGTTVRIELPLTLATLRGTLVRAANRDFVIPTANVVRVVRAPRSSIRRVENRDSICLDGTTLALVRLADVLGLVSGQTAGDSTAPLTALVLAHGQTCIGLAVDQVIGEQEVLAKPLSRLLPRVRNLAGATVFGTGRVVPILNVPDLLQTVVGCAQTTALESVPGASAETARVRELLVVDDSITTRTLLQNILESSGYSVKTAPDGAAAFAALQTAPFDLVVSDVEMPRMDGFELTKRVRAEPKLADLPVVLVTAREAKEDRERGIDAGANAYIVKSGFDQSNLLDVIGTLI